MFKILLIRALKKQSIDYPSINLTSRQLFDLELILNGGFSPLNGFMTKDEYESVLDNAVLPNGLTWPIPVCLDISEKVMVLFTPYSILIKSCDNRSRMLPDV